MEYKGKKKKSIAKNAVFNVTYKLLNILFPLLTSAYLSRILGPVYLGKVSYAQNIMSYFLVIASLGIGTYGMREIAKAENNINNKNKIFSELFLLNLISSAICGILYTAAISMVGRFHADICLYLCTGLTLYMNIFNVDWFYTGQEEYAYITIRSFIIKLFSIISIFLFVKDQSDYIIYALITSLATTSNYVLNVINLRKHVRFRFDALKIKRHINSILILLATIFATDLYNQVDVTMLGIFRSEAEVGYYSNGIKLIRVIYSITIAISASIIPRMSQYYKNGKLKEYKILFWKTMDTVLILAIPATVGLLLLSEQIVFTLFGSRFAPTVTVINTLSIMVVVITISYLTGSVVLTSTNNEKYLLVATVSGCLVNICLNALFIPKIGITGAALASVIAEFTVAVIHIRFGCQYIKAKIPFKNISTILVGSAVMVICVLILRSTIQIEHVNLILCMATGLIIYFVIIFLMKNEIVMICVAKAEEIVRKSNLLI